MLWNLRHVKEEGLPYIQNQNRLDQACLQERNYLLQRQWSLDQTTVNLNFAYSQILADSKSPQS